MSSLVLRFLMCTMEWLIVISLDSFKTVVSSTALGTWDTLTRCHFLFSSWAFIQEQIGGVEKIISGKVGEMILVAMWVASAWKKITD